MDNPAKLQVELPGHDGTALRGDLYLPVGEAGPFPGVVMAHGFSATRSMALEAYAVRFAQVGLAVLVYDHARLGESDGEPRQHVNPWAQARDYRRAVDWISARPEVDGGRIGLWGSSYSGGQVIVVGAADRRVRAVVANVPFVGLPDVAYGADVEARCDELLAAFGDETGGGPADRDDDVIGPFAVVVEDGVDMPPFLPDPDAAEWFLDLGRQPGAGWHNRVTVGGIRSLPKWDPGVCVQRLAPTPVLMVVALEDALADTSIALAAFERAGEPKSLVTIPGHHFEPYSGAARDQAIAAAADWFLDWL